MTLQLVATNAAPLASTVVRPALTLASSTPDPKSPEAFMDATMSIALDAFAGEDIEQRMAALSASLGLPIHVVIDAVEMQLELLRD